MSRRAATTSPSSPTCASRSRATAVRSAAARSRSRPRSRSGTSSTSPTSTARGSAPPSSTRTGKRSRCWAAATESGRGACSRRSSSSATTRTASSGHASIAPYDVHLVVLKGAEEIGEQAAQALSEAGYDVLLDDRDQRPGEKFADADLIGMPDPYHRGKEKPRGRQGRRSRSGQAAPRDD